mmetsp:Transcript_64582/g.174500  ORF Transcript_64582/g.174500 Transcript_64582/m.174500 type:complete len:234 (+) Transcript_64582:108-809(+)
MGIFGGGLLYEWPVDIEAAPTFLARLRAAEKPDAAGEEAERAALRWELEQAAQVVSAVEEESNTGSDERLRFKTQFRKSQLCRYYKTGCMRGDQCDFAHGTEELSLAPDLTKTSMCKAWQRGRCSLDSGACPYAHGASELRCTTGYLKSAPCSMFFQGRCKLGNSCRHAHSLAEIRSAQAFLTSKKSRAVAPAALAPRPAAVAAAMVEARAPGQLSGAVLGFPPPRGALDVYQ